MTAAGARETEYIKLPGAIPIYQLDSVELIAPEKMGSWMPVHGSTVPCHVHGHIYARFMTNYINTNIPLAVPTFTDAFKKKGSAFLHA